MNLRNSRTYAIWAVGIGGIVAVATLFLFLFLSPTPTSLSQPINTLTFAQYGALVGGVVGTLFSLAAVLLLIHNLDVQEANNVRQKIESRFFELLKIHIENSNTVNIQTLVGRRNFIGMLEEYALAVNVLDPVQRKYKLSQAQAINVAYLTFYYGGIGQISTEILRQRLAPIHGGELVEDVILTVKEYLQRPAAAVRSFQHMPFDGHQLRLGHYFRHLYQTVSYVNSQGEEVLKYSDKYNYVKTLRAQFSTHEQALLFLNSLSDLGRVWELDIPVGDINNRLITKYNLVKNIPHGFLPGVDVQKWPRKFEQRYKWKLWV